jgi:uncharacterized membrane protein
MNFNIPLPAMTLLGTDRGISLLAQISEWTDGFTHILVEDIGRIAWNIFLALIPLTLSFFLFYKPRSRIFCWSTYLLLALSFIVGIKKYNDGNFLIALQSILLSLWGVRAIFVAIALGLIIVLLTIDLRSRSADTNNRSLLWWIGLLPFIAILPNAPYILTDIIHFYAAVRAIDSVWAITLTVVPIYIVFIGVGWFSYVFSLVNISKYLDRVNLDRYTSITEVGIHFLCAIGIYIGRFIRFNSWSLLTQPRKFLSILPGELIGKFPLVVILITFLIITIVYSISKPIVEKSELYSRA